MHTIGSDASLTKMASQAIQDPGRPVVVPPALAKLTTPTPGSIPTYDYIRELDQTAQAGRVLQGKGSFRIISLPRQQWTTENMDAHPSWGWVYGEQAADKGNQLLPKDCEVFWAQLPESHTARRHVNGMGIPVCNYDCGHFKDENLGPNKEKMRVATRFILERASSPNIDTLVVPAQGDLAPWHDLARTAPSTHTALQEQLRRLYREAAGYQPASKNMTDTADTGWSGPDSARHLSDPSGGMNFGWDTELNADAVLSEDIVAGQLMAQSKPVRPDPDKIVGRSGHLGAYCNLYTEDGTQFTGCVDEGSCAGPTEDTCYIDTGLALNLGLRINPRDMRSIDVAGDHSQRTSGSVKLHLKMESYDLGWLTLQCIPLPNSIGVLLGANEKRRLGIETKWSKEHKVPHFELGFGNEKHTLPFIKRPRECSKKACQDWQKLLREQREKFGRWRHKVLSIHTDNSQFSFPSDREEIRTIVEHELNQREARQDSAQVFHVDTPEGELEIDIGFGSAAEVKEIDDYHQLHGEAGTLDDLDDTWALTFCAKHGIEYDDALLQLELEDPALQTRSQDLSAEQRSLFLTGKKAIDDLPELTPAEKGQFLADYRRQGKLRPESMAADYSICPAFLADKLHQRNELGEKLWQELLAAWRLPGKCMMWEEMNGDQSNFGTPVQLKPKVGHENVSFHHKSRIPLNARATVEAYIKDLLAKKVIRECNDSQTISRILFVRKKGTSKLRVVLDAKEANSHLRPVKARLMSVEEVLAGIDPDATVYSVVDLLSGFWSSAIMDDGSQQWTAMDTHIGVYAWRQMTMGNQGSPAMFTRHVGEALSRWGLCGADQFRPWQREHEDGSSTPEEPGFAEASANRARLTEQGRKMHDYYSSGEWAYRADEAHTKEMDFDWAIPYVDDCLICARDYRGMHRRMNMLMHCLSAENFHVNPDKVFAYTTACEFLGSCIASTHDGNDPSGAASTRIYAAPSRICDLLRLPPPTTKRALMSSLQSLGWFRNHCAAFSAVAAPLSALTSSLVDFKKAWTSVHDKAWEDLLMTLARSTCRVIPQRNKRKILVCDAAQSAGLGGFLGQVNDDGLIEPIGFASRALHGGEVDLPARAIERAAIIMLLDKFGDLLWGDDNVLECRSDHKSLSALSSAARLGVIDQREQTQLDFLSRFNLDIVYTNNSAGCIRVADELSRRLPQHASELGLTRGAGRNKYGRVYGTGPLDHLPGMQNSYLTGELLPDMKINKNQNWNLDPAQPQEAWRGEDFAATNDYSEPPLRPDKATAAVTHSSADGGDQHPTGSLIGAIRSMAGVRTRFRLTPDPDYPNATRHVELDDDTSLAIHKQLNVLDSKGNPPALDRHHDIVEQCVPELKGLLAVETVSHQLSPEHFPHGFCEDSDDVDKHECLVLPGVKSNQGRSAVMLNESEDLIRCRSGFKYEGDEAILRDVLAQRLSRRDHRELEPALRVTKLHASGVLQRRALSSGGIWRWLIMVPKQDRARQEALTRLFHEQHGHLNGHATHDIIREKYIWPGMRKTIFVDVDKCSSCKRTNPQTHKGYGMPMTTVPTAVPWASISIDIYKPPKACDGYDGVLVVIDHATRYTLLIAHKSTNTSLDNAQLLYSHVFAPFGFPELIRSDNERALVDGAWQRLREVCDISQVTSSAMNSASNGLAERRIRFAERIFKTHLEGKSAKGWVEVLPTIQAMCNGYPHPGSGISSDQALFGYRPRRITDMIHNIDTLPAGLFRDNLETNQQLLDRLRTSMLDQHQQGAEEMASRMALRYRDAPEAWGNEKDHRTWWVFLKREAFSDATHNVSGLRNKHYSMPSAGPYEVSKIWDAGLHFSIVLPHKMQLRRENKFNIKHVRAFTDEMPEAGDLMRTKIDEMNDEPLLKRSSTEPDDHDDEQVYEVETLKERTYNTQTKRYEYIVVWKGYGPDDVTREPRDNLQKSARHLLKDYEDMYPIGSHPTDKKSDQDKFAASSIQDIQDQRLSEQRSQAISDRAARKNRRAQLATIGCFDGDDLRQHVQEQETLHYLLQTNPEVFLLKANELHYFYEIMENETTMPSTQDNSRQLHETT